MWKNQNDQNSNRILKTYCEATQWSSRYSPIGEIIDFVYVCFYTVFWHILMLSQNNWNGYYSYNTMILQFCDITCLHICLCFFYATRRKHVNSKLIYSK